jgi:nucleoid-associated protein YejK
MTVYNQPDLIGYIQDNTPKVKDRKVFVIINDVGEVLDIGKRYGIFTSKSGAKQALNRYVSNKMKWYEYSRNIQGSQRLLGNELDNEVRETVEFLLSNKLVVISEMIV